MYNYNGIMRKLNAIGDFPVLTGLEDEETEFTYWVLCWTDSWVVWTYLSAHQLMLEHGPALASSSYKQIFFFKSKAEAVFAIPDKYRGAEISAQPFTFRWSHGQWLPLPPAMKGNPLQSHDA